MKIHELHRLLTDIASANPDADVAVSSDGSLRVDFNVEVLPGQGFGGVPLVVLEPDYSEE